MRIFILLLLMMSCGQTQVVVDHDLKGCENYDPDNPPEEALAYREGELSIEVYRDGVTQGCSAQFDPDISLEEGVILVREYWEEDDGESCTTCFNPTIILKDPDPGEYDVEWYLGDSQIPFDNLQFEVD